MSSSVFFKFKSQKEPTRVEFDGTGISVFELKREVIIKSGLGDGRDFDLALYSEDTNEEYDDDTTIIPRSTTVIARRQPAAKPGAGRAARYVTGRMPVTAKNAGRREQGSKLSSSKGLSDAISQMNNAMTEEERMQAMFQAQNEQLQVNQEEIHQQNSNFRPKRPVHVPDYEPPKTYICHRCNTPGHWIQACPTNNDTEFDNRPRLKRTTGIPKTYLKTVNQEEALAMMNSDEKVNLRKDGDQYVITQVDTKAWQKFQAKTKATGPAMDPAMEKDMREKDLECPAYHGESRSRLFIDPMKTPCCQQTYCNDCINNALIESDFVCPACKQDGALLDDLKPDHEAAEKLKEFTAFWDATKAEKERETAEQQQASARATGSPPPPTEPSQKGRGPRAAKTWSPVESSSSDGKKKAAQPRKRSPTPPGNQTQSPPAVATATAAAANPNTGDNAAAAAAAAACSSHPANATNHQGTQFRKRTAPDDFLDNPRIPKGPKAMQQKSEPEPQAMMATMNGMLGMPMMPFNMAGMGGMGMNFPMGMPGMNMGNMGGNMSMTMMNPMAGPMMGMANFDPGFANMNGGGPVMGGGGGFDNMGMGMNGNHQTGMCGRQHNFQSGYFRQEGGSDDGAYFRKPVNPHRHQNRQRRIRPSDYREL